MGDVSIKTLEFIIISFCSFKDPTVLREYKERCMEHMLNCSVRGISDGKSTTSKRIEQCRDGWIENEHNVPKYRSNL